MSSAVIGVLLVAGFTGGAVYAGHHGADDVSGSDSITVSRAGSFELAMTPEKALPLFTAPGERLWITTWDPTVFNGDGIEEGTVFTTYNHGHTTYWLVMDYGTHAHAAAPGNVPARVGDGAHQSVRDAEVRRVGDRLGEDPRDHHRRHQHAGADIASLAERPPKNSPVERARGAIRIMTAA